MQSIVEIFRVKLLLVCQYSRSNDATVIQSDKIVYCSTHSFPYSVESLPSVNITFKHFKSPLFI